ncbi:hypothetical protein HID58_010912 [Brassica napus]|uniref:Uncharacterized protein n=1 Tax=Brassica napus TaxID=3708 RepID=A0ABQ8DWN8_BRANA|nr:hypothetical protein HID58_010912 [Brassica napus]
MHIYSSIHFILLSYKSSNSLSLL